MAGLERIDKIVQAMMSGKGSSRASEDTPRQKQIDSELDDIFKGREKPKKKKSKKKKSKKKSKKKKTYSFY